METLEDLFCKGKYEILGPFLRKWCFKDLEVMNTRILINSVPINLKLSILTLINEKLSVYLGKRDPFIKYEDGETTNDNVRIGKLLCWGEYKRLDSYFNELFKDISNIDLEQKRTSIDTNDIELYDKFVCNILEWYQ